MSSHVGSYRPWLCSALLLGLLAVPSAAQPPSPLELVRGLREHGQVELAMEYLKELEGKPLAPDDKAAISLERAKCLLEASEEEPDEGSRVGMVSEAKEGLNTFLINHANHPRVVEALLAAAKLTSLDAREQLNRARRMEVPPPGETPEENAAREAAQEKQKAEAARARPLFLLASKRFAEASEKIRVKLDDKALDANARKTLEREAFEAELAAAINQFNTAETFMPVQRITTNEKAERNKYLEAAKETFGKLAKGSQANRTAWVARAWVAEVTFEQDDFNNAAAEVGAILKANVPEAEDGKRLARFFQLRRNYLVALGEKNLQKALASEQELRGWLRQYGNPRKPTSEVFAVRYYLARVLQALAETAIGPPRKDGQPVTVSASARAQLAEAERLYRALAHTDNDFTARASRNRMLVVRRMLGDADQSPSAYTTFEQAQLASLIQMSKLAAEEAKKEPDQKKVTAIRMAAVALLERARDLAAPTDNPADVTDVLLRLIFFYQLSDQPYQAAVLGEHVAHTIKSTGGKAALAGLLGLNGYVVASTRIRGEEPDAVAAARKTDRERAFALARFLDQKFPNDNATDAARHRLASMLLEDKQPVEAFEVIIKVRPAYSQVTSARLLEGYLAAQLVNARENPLPEAKRAEVFKRAVADLAKVPKPASVALEEEVRNYISARCRLAQLMFAQGRADPAAEKANPGSAQGLAIAEDVLGLIPTFDSMAKTEGGAKKLTLDGHEMTMLAQDVHARAVYLRARALIDAGQLDDAGKALDPLLGAVRTNGAVFSAEMKAWAEGAGSGEPEAIHKAKVADLAAKVDKTRVDVILAGFRLKVRQGKAGDAGEMLDLMVKAGGSVEDNLPTLELLGREMAAQMTVFRKEGKEKEAKDIGAGLSVLLKKITALPKLTTQSRLFVGQTLQNVGENDEAIKTLSEIKPPDFDGWDKKSPEEIPQEIRGRVQGQIRDYSIAQLTIARALRDSKKFAEAEAKLQGIIGTNEKKGWGYGRLYFRRELAFVYEDRGAATADLKAATAEWGKAKQVWEQLVGIQRNRLQNAANANPEQLKQYRNAFAEAYFDVQRCLVKANQQLIKDPARLQAFYDTTAKRMVDLERQKDFPPADWQPEVQHQYAELLKAKGSEGLLAAYKATGGKLFLEKMPVP